MSPGAAIQQHVLSLCDRSGNACIPWAEAGYHCIAVDIEATERTRDVGDGVIEHVQADVFDYEPPEGEYAIGLGWPPCTDLAYSGARWFDEKGWTALGDALKLAGRVRDLLETLDAPYMVENPASRLQKAWGQPDYRFDPYEYDAYTELDERYTKETWIWTGGGFRIPKPMGCDRQEADDRIHTMPPSEDRAEKRSETPLGWARAVFLAQTRSTDYAWKQGRQADLTEVSAIEQ